MSKGGVRSIRNVRQINPPVRGTAAPLRPNIRLPCYPLQMLDVLIATSG